MDDLFASQADDRQQADEANEQLYEELVRVLYDCLMRGVPEQDVKLLTYQCGIHPKDVEQYVPTIQRSKA